MPPAPELSAEEFAGRVQEAFGLADPPSLSTGLSDELEFDSIDHFELVVLCEELAGIPAEDEGADYPLLATLKDAYAYYEQRREDRR